MRYRRPTHAARLFVILGLSAGLGACAGGGGASSGDSGPRRSANLITAEELTDLASESALTAVRRLRPRWLQSRGAAANMPVTLLDGQRLGIDPNALDQISVSDIGSIRYLSASDATLRYGTNYPGGAIVVESRVR